MYDKGLEIRLERERTGITMKEIAEMMNVSESTLYRWLREGNAEKADEILEEIRTIELLKD